MPATTFEARFVTQDEKADAPPFFIAGKKLTERGMDQVEFYFSPNPGRTAETAGKDRFRRRTVAPDARPQSPWS